MESSNSKSLDLSGISGVHEEENDSLLELSSYDTQEIEALEPDDVDLDKRSVLLKMNFPVEDTDLAITRLGENASVSELVDFIIAIQKARSSGEKMDHMDDSVHDEDTNSQEFTMEASLRSITLRLLEMGFSEEEISMAIDNFGSDTPICELADSIFANRIARECTKEDKDLLTDRGTCSSQHQSESRCLGLATEVLSKHALSVTEIEVIRRESSSAVPYGPREMRKRKKAKRESSTKQIPLNGNCWQGTGMSSPAAFDQRVASCKNSGNGAETGCFSAKLPENRVLKDRKTDCRYPSEPPYFFYANINDISQATWTKLSQFLYGVKPEYADTLYFSAFFRKEGYIHNLPTENRFHIIPRPPMTIKDAVLHTKQWWPSWDTRKKMSGITSDTTSAAGLCEQLEKMIQSQGILSKEQQADTLQQCKTHNLVWVGEHKLRPIQPEHVEHILGYPEHHTQMQGLKDTDRFKALKMSFQTDTLGYHLSSLKQLYPSGLRILSVFSGTGGAEVALSRLGIHLKCVVSVEDSGINRQILRRWWQRTGQSGELRQIECIWKLNGQKIASLVEEFGGFDLVIAGNTSAATNSKGDKAGVNFDLFLEFVCVFQRVRGVMARN